MSKELDEFLRNLPGDSKKGFGDLDKKNDEQKNADGSPADHKKDGDNGDGSASHQASESDKKDDNY